MRKSINEKAWDGEWYMRCLLYTSNVTNAIAAVSGTYYCKWIFGNDNLVAITGIAGLAATLLGFVLAKPIISKLGIKKTVYFGVLGLSLIHI